MPTSLERRAAATPRVTVKNGAAYWQPSRSLRILGFTGQSLGRLCPDALNRADDLNEAADAHVAARTGVRPPAASLAGAIADYLASPDFDALRASTRAHYRRHLARAAADLGHELLDQIPPKRIEAWHGRLAASGARDAYNHLATLRTALQWAVKDRRARSNPALLVAVGRPARRARIATRAELWSMVAAAEARGLPAIALATILMTSTMQRPADVLALTAGQIEDGALYLTQSKTGVDLSFRLHPVAADSLETGRAADALLIARPGGAAYGERAFQRAWAMVRADAARSCPSLTGTDPAVRARTLKGPLNAADLRRTGMVWAAEGGASIAEICSVSGHNLQSGLTILETYLPRARILADRAIARLDMIRTPRIEDLAVTMLAC